MAGASIAWDNTNPENTDAAGNGAQEIRSLKTNLQAGLDAEHVWPIAGGVSGAHRVGSARAYVAPTASTVSSDGTDGRMVINAVDNTLWTARSATSIELVGHPGLLFMSSSSFSAPPKFGTSVQAGVSSTNVSGLTRITFPSAYSGAPIVTVTSLNNGFLVGLTAQSGTTGFQAYGVNPSTAAAANVGFNWISVGTVSMGVV